MQFREGDFIETGENLIFDVKGMVHPPGKVVAYVRYIPDSEGERQRNGQRFRKVYDLSERSEYLRRNHPEYLAYDAVFDEVLNIVPTERVTVHYEPVQKAFEIRKGRRLRIEEEQALGFINRIMDSADVSARSIGVSGSILVGLSNRSSDIDVIVYGSEECMRVNEALGKLLSEGGDFRVFDMDVMRARYMERQADAGVSFDRYVFHELRKPFQGCYKCREFFVRYIRDWSEMGERYGDRHYKNAGYVTVKGLVADDFESLFTPCTYLVDDVTIVEGKECAPIREVASFRGRFCQQAKTGERFIARGKMERVEAGGRLYHRLLLGNTPNDFMVTLRD